MVERCAAMTDAPALCMAPHTRHGCEPAAAAAPSVAAGIAALVAYVLSSNAEVGSKLGGAKVDAFCIAPAACMSSDVAAACGGYVTSLVMRYDLVGSRRAPSCMLCAARRSPYQQLGPGAPRSATPISACAAERSAWRFQTCYHAHEGAALCQRKHAAADDPIKKHAPLPLCARR